MAELPPQVLSAVGAKLEGVEDQLRLMPVQEVLESQDLEWSFGLTGRWHMFVEVDTDNLRVESDELIIDLAVSVGRLVARPRMRRQLRLPLPRK